MSERERLAFLSGAETMAEEIAKAVEQSEYQWAAHYAAFIRALPLLKPDEAALLRASAPPADVAELTERLESYDFQCEAGDLRHCIDWHKIKDALAALAGERDRLREALQEMEVRKDDAYSERNKLVAWLARCYPSGIAKTAIEGWSDDWHGCVYIDLPTGQVSWHYHDSQAGLFLGLPAYHRGWDGHTTDQKYERLAALWDSYAAEMVKHARAALGGSDAK